MAFWWVTLAAGAATEYRLGEIFPHRVNLALHEAGRSVFAPLGKFSEAVGGPLLQLLLPALCGLAFLWRRRDSFGAAVCLWWLGGSLLSMSPYILGGAHFDALLPQGGATGGESLCVYRDWEILLRALGLLEMDHLLAIAAQWIGTLLMGLGTLWSIPLLFRRPQAGESA